MIRAIHIQIDGTGVWISGLVLYILFSELTCSPVNKVSQVSPNPVKRACSIGRTDC